MEFGGGGVVVVVLPSTIPKISIVSHFSGDTVKNHIWVSPEAAAAEESWEAEKCCPCAVPELWPALFLSGPGWSPELLWDHPSLLQVISMPLNTCPKKTGTAKILALLYYWKADSWSSYLCWPWRDWACLKYWWWDCLSTWAEEYSSRRNGRIFFSHWTWQYECCVEKW